MSAERDELAKAVFVADNYNATDDVTLSDWEALVESDGDASYAHRIAQGLIQAGYRKTEPRWAETLINDGTYEYTASSDCDGSNVTHWRRTPGKVCIEDASPWAAYEPDPQP